MAFALTIAVAFQIGRAMRTRVPGLTFACVAALSVAAPAWAFYLDKGRNFDVRLRAYSQLAIMTEASGEDWPETGKYEVGDLAQHRNFYNPEFDARLTDYSRWMASVPGLSLLAPDDLKFRFAWWGFYDGLYDYLNGPWNTNRQNYRTRFSQSDNVRQESFNFNDEYKNPRHIYAKRNRINELYVDYTKGRFFLRVGRQAISWGESDDIALLDVTNPFDLTLGAPGFFQDVDEARIPLWTVRSTIKLVDSWSFLSSAFVDMYLVPGPIDTTVPINPITAGVSPFNPDQSDPQLQLDALGQGGTLHTVLVDRLPERDWGNSRWGVRLTGVLFRDYTVQTWFFRTFNQAPVPHLVGPSPIDLLADGRIGRTQVDDRGRRVPVCNNIGPDGFGRTPSGRACKRAIPVVTILERRLESVIGLAATWFWQPVNGIIRTEAEYFHDEPAFIPDQNLNPLANVPSVFLGGRQNARTNNVPVTDYLRWIIGYDRFFFVRALNPANSFVLSTAWHGEWNIHETEQSDFRYTGAGKPGKPQVVPGQRIPGVAACDPPTAGTAPFCLRAPPKNFEDRKKFDSNFLQIALQTDYLHGRLSPRLVIIADVSGIFGFAPSTVYRFSDNFLGSVTYLAIAASRRAGLGTFRAHDMVQLRLTYQLN